MTIISRSTSRTCFGHIAQPNEPAITDALSAMLAVAPANYFDQWREGELNRGVDVAEGLVARAILRMFALRKLMADRGRPTLKKRDRENCHAAHLLIAADLVAALLADCSKATIGQVTRAIGMLFPDVGTDGALMELDIDADRSAALGITDLLNGATPGDLQAIGRWYQSLPLDMAERHSVVGLFNAVAVVRDVLFSAVHDRGYNLSEMGLSRKAVHACMIAEGLSIELANRKSDVRGIMQPTR